MGIHASAKISTLTQPEIREARLRAEVRGEVDVATYAAALDVLEKILDELGRGKSSLCEIADAFDLGDELTTAVNEIDKRIDEADERETAACEEAKQSREDADKRCLEMGLQCNDLRRRAEKAEHAGTLLRERIETCEELQKQIADQERMLDAFARVVAARDLGPDAQTLAMAVLGVERHRTLSRVWKEREEAKEGQESASPAEGATEARKKAVRKRSEKKV